MTTSENLLAAEIVDCFASSQQPELLKQAEAKLQELQTFHDFIPTLITLGLHNQQAAIYLKNFLKQKKQVDLKTVRLIFDGIQKSQETKKIILSSFQVILSKVNVQELLKPVTEMFTKDIMTATLILVEIVKHFQWYQSEKRQVLNSFIRQLFPGLLQIATTLLDRPEDPANLQILKNIAKTYASSTRMDMAVEMLAMDWIVPWASCFIRIVELTEPANNPNTAIFWKLKKWSYTSLNSMMGRYALARKRDKKFTIFSKTFIQNFAPKILSTYLTQIQHQLQGQKVSPRVAQCQLVFLEYICRTKSTFTHLEPHLEVIVRQVILPLLYFSKDDQELWQDDQVEYVHKKIDPPLEDFKSPQTAAEDLMEAFVRHRAEKTFVPLMTLLNEILSSSPPPEVKYGLLTCLSKLSEHCQTSESLLTQLPAFLTQYVIPELNSPYDFLKSKACDTLVQYSAVDLPQETVIHILNSLTVLLNHATLSCRVSASLALSPLFKYGYVTEALRPHAVVVMQTLMTLTETVQLDTLTGVMEIFVYEFSAELAPFARDLASRLVATCMEVLSEDSEDRYMAAAGVIKTLDGLVMSLDGRVEMLRDLEPVLCPLIVHVLSDSLLDLYEEIMEMVSTMLYCAKSVSPALWQIFSQLLPVVLENLEYMEDMSSLLDNYIGFGSEFIKGNQEMQEMLVMLIKKVLADVDGGEADRIRAMLIMESMMLNLRGGIDNVIPTFVELAYTLLVKEKVKTSIYRVHLIDVILNVLCYNVGMGLSLLEHINWTGPFLELWFKNLEGMRRVHDKKLSIIVICQILTMSVDALPPILKTVWPQLVDGLLKVFGGYEEALKERKRLENGDFRSDGGDDYANYDFGDDDDFDDGEPMGDTISQLVDQAAAHAPNPEDDESDDGEWDVEEFMIEDISFSTILDKVDAYVLLTKTMDHIGSTGRGAVLGERLNAEQQKFLEACVVKGRALLAK